MFLRVDFEKQLFCNLFGDIYNRLLIFGLEHNHTQNHIKSRIMGIFAGDNTIHLLVDLSDTGTITGHCLLVFTQIDADKYTCFCEQMQVDRNGDSKFVQACIDYVSSMVGVVKISMVTEEKRARAYKKKYGFEIDQVLMELDLNKEGSE